MSEMTTDVNFASDDSIVEYLPIDTLLYPVDAIFRAAYKFTDRWYIFLKKEEEHTIIAEFRRRHTTDEISQVVGTFMNELIDQRIRIDLARDTRSIRDLIVTQAFVEADLNVE